MSVVIIEQLRAARSSSFCLDIPELRLDAGRILCIVGPNGCGKTTLIESIAGLLRPKHGAIQLAGHELRGEMRSIKARLGYVPDDEGWLIQELSAREYFTLLEDVYHKAGVTADIKWRASMIAHKLSFSDFDARLSSLSHGNKKKVQIIAGLMHMPRVIIIDELRNGLDPLSIIAAEALVRDEARRGACVIAATHDLWWAERFAHDILLLNEGHIAIHDKKANLLKRFGSLERMFLAQATGAVPQ